MSFAKRRYVLVALMCMSLSVLVACSKSEDHCPPGGCRTATPNPLAPLSAAQQIDNILNPIAARYSVQKKAIDPNDYYSVTKPLVQRGQLPTSYYDLTTVTSTLQLSDYEQIAPLILDDLIAEHDTNLPKYLNVGVAAYFHPESTQKPAAPDKYMVSPSGYADLDNQAFKTFDAKANVYMAVFNGPTDPNFDGKQVVHVDFKGVYIKAWDTTSSAVMGGSVSPGGGETMDVQLLFDPTTNANIGIARTIYP